MIVIHRKQKTDMEAGRLDSPPAVSGIYDTLHRVGRRLIPPTTDAGVQNLSLLIVNTSLLLFNFLHTKQLLHFTCYYIASQTTPF